MCRKRGAMSKWRMHTLCTFIVTPVQGVSICKLRRVCKFRIPVANGGKLHRDGGSFDRMLDIGSAFCLFLFLLLLLPYRYYYIKKYIYAKILKLWSKQKNKKNLGPRLKSAGSRKRIHIRGIDSRTTCSCTTGVTRRIDVRKLMIVVEETDAHFVYGPFSATGDCSFFIIIIFLMS